LRKSNVALSADASYKKLITGNDVAIFGYVREKNKHKVAVLLNFSNQPQRFTIKDVSIYGKPLNVFSGKKENVNRYHVFSLQPWDYLVFDYDK
jgi:hypothetical protein